MDIKGYYQCSCGAVTIVMDDGDYSCCKKNLKKFFPEIDLRKTPCFQKVFACNHCINHFGLDLCGCGSGEPFGACSENFDECSKPMQIVGQYTRVRACGAWC